MEKRLPPPGAALLSGDKVCQGSWHQYSDASGRLYYYNADTNEVSWTIRSSPKERDVGAGVGEDDSMSLLQMEDLDLRISLYDNPDTHDDEETLEDGSGDSEYDSSSVYFYALVRSVEEGKIFIAPLFLCILVLLIQMAVLNGLLFKILVSVIPETHTWSDLINMPVMLSEKVGIFAALLAVPIVLIAKLGSNGEFNDAAVFVSALAWYNRKPWVKKDPKRRFLLFFWLLMHAARAFFILPSFVFINAKLLADETNLKFVMIRVMTIAFLLELDDDIFACLYKGSKDVTKYSKKQIGARTKEHCTQVKNNTVYVLAVFQILIVIMLKIKSTLYELYLLPAAGIAIYTVYIRYFPTSATMFNGLTLAFICVYAGWFSFIKCFFFPICTEEGNPFGTVVPLELFFPSTTHGLSPLGDLSAY